MKVLVVIARLGVGGAERLAIDDINEMLRRGWDVRLVTFRPEKPSTLNAQCKIAPENWRVINIRTLFNVTGWIVFIRFVRAWQPDFIVSHLWLANAISRGSWPAHRRPVLALEENMADIKTLQMRAVDRLLERVPGRIVAVSQAVRASLVAQGISEKKIVTIPNALDLSRYRAMAPAAPHEGFVYAFAGRLIHQKGVDILLRAFAQLEKGRLLIAGEGPDRTALEALAEELRIQERVSFVGIRHDLPEFFAEADCFVLPSRYEGLPIVLIEAMAAGKAIVVSDFGAAREVLKEGETGLIVPRENPEELARAMGRVASDAPLRQRLGEAARHAAERYSIEQHVEKLAALL